jgi:uncharacterized protein YjbJ (UPF0337 family)
MTVQELINHLNQVNGKYKEVIMEITDDDLSLNIIGIAEVESSLIISCDYD